MKKLLACLLLFGSAVAGATTMQFQGYYYNYTGKDACHRVSAVLTLTVTDQGSEVLIEAPGASCAPPVFSNGSVKELAGIFSHYIVKMDASTACEFHAFKKYKVHFNIKNDGSIDDPIVKENRNSWGKTLFEVKPHTVWGICE